MIIIATATPDYPIPGTSPLVQELLGIEECAVMDVRFESPILSPISFLILIG